MKTAAIVLSAGKGSRMKADIPKQFMDLNGHPVVWYSLKNFQESDVDDIILVVPEEETETWDVRCRGEYGFDKVKAVVAGGKERFHSVFSGMSRLAEGQYDYVLIHDGARPMITKEQIDEMIRTVVEKQACIFGMPVKDTIKCVDSEGKVYDTPDRSVLWQIQTPQAFSFPKLWNAYQLLQQSNQTAGITDDAMVWETWVREPVFLMKGGYRNFKLTTPEDYIFAKVSLQDNNKQ